MPDVRNKSRGSMLRLQGIIDGYEGDKKLEMKQEWVTIDSSNKRKGKGGVGKDGGRTWGIWVVQMICELLAVGSSPTAIRDSLRIVVSHIMHVCAFIHTALVLLLILASV